MSKILSDGGTVSGSGVLLLVLGEDGFLHFLIGVVLVTMSRCVSVSDSVSDSDSDFDSVSGSESESDFVSDWIISGDPSPVLGESDFDFPKSVVKSELKSDDIVSDRPLVIVKDELVDRLGGV